MPRRLHRPCQQAMHKKGYLLVKRSRSVAQWLNDEGATRKEILQVGKHLARRAQICERVGQYHLPLVFDLQFDVLHLLHLRPPDFDAFYL